MRPVVPKKIYKSFWVSIQRNFRDVQGIGLKKEHYVQYTYSECYMHHFFFKNVLHLSNLCMQLMRLIYSMCKVAEGTRTQKFSALIGILQFWRLPLRCFYCKWL